MIPLLALLCVVPGAEGQTKDTQKGAALLAEARRALGGADRLNDVKALDVKGDFKRVAGTTTISGELQVRLELPDKLRRDEDLSPPGGGPAVVRTEVLNGSTVWDENSSGRMFGGFGRAGGFGRGGGSPGDSSGGGSREGQAGDRRQIDPARLEEMQRRTRQADLGRYALVWLLRTDGEAAWIGTAESPDGKADVIELAMPAGPALRLFLDVSSHIPLMITWQGAVPQLTGGRRGGDAAGPSGGGGRGDSPRTPPVFRITLDNYKPINGIKLPHLITRAANDVTLEEWTVESYRLNPAFRAGVFTK